MTQKTYFVKPKPGLIVRNPDGNFQPIPESGARVNRNPYWLGQIRDGSVTIVPDADVSEAPKPAGRVTTATRTTPAKPA